MDEPRLTPRLVCRPAGQAIDFYVDAFGATLLERFDAPDGRVVHAALDFGGAIVALTDEDLEHNASPAHLGGSAVLLMLSCDDPDALATRAVERGARIVFPIDDQFYGRREGRLRDPFGHLWIVGREIETLDDEEIQRRVEEHEG